MSGPSRASSGLLVRTLIVLLVAGAVFAIAYDDGSYAIEARGVLAIAVWWAVIVCAVFRATPADRLGLRGPVVVVAGLMAALAMLTLSSLLWAPNVEGAMAEVNRVTLYLGVLVLVALVVPRGGAEAWSDGLALAVSAVGVVALVSRLLPDAFGDRGLATLLPAAATRLSFPVGYWNGLGILLALGVPLLLRRALVGANALERGLAVAPLPIIGAAVYLTSSRGAVATAGVATAVFLFLTPRRLEAATAAAVGGLGIAGAIVVLSSRGELVNGPVGSALARDQGRSAAVLIALLVVAVTVAHAAVAPLVRRARPPVRLARAAAGAAVLAIVIGTVAADPVERARAFRTLPSEAGLAAERDFVRAHLLSGSGSGRWQFWGSAVDQWRDHPLTGGGAGTYEAWWAEHGSFPYFLRDGHSLYLEMLGELGPLGFALTLAIAVFGVAVGIRRTRRLDGAPRTSAAALTAVVAAWAVAAGVDWMWELTAVTVVALVALALVTGAGTEPPRALRLTGPGERPPTRLRFGLAVGGLAAGWAVIVAQAVLLLGHFELQRSRDAVAEGNAAEARGAALAARDIQPWAASPYLQLALIDERLGRVGLAREWAGDAIERSPNDWRLWLVAARLDTKLGRIDDAKRSLARAVDLNPRSPLFTQLT